MESNERISNGKKTQSVLFRPKGKKNFTINESLIVKDQVIDRVKSAKYLGVCFDKDLNFNEHFRQVK